MSGEARSLSRREAIARLLGAGMVTTVGADLLEAFSAPATLPYRPRFFGDADLRTVAALASRIIPTDETPGAREARVEEWIDFFAAAAEDSRQSLYRGGLARLESLCRERHGTVFTALDSAQQDEALTRLAQSAPDFFEAIKGDTIVGFYTSEIGLKELSWGGQSFHTECPGCTHPEHLQGTAPAVRPSGRPPAP
jgi:glucoside 3-dehydrogenase (cytochrome c) hitch-hiker subunit